MSKLIFIFSLMIISSLAWADSAKCTVEIEDLNAGTKSKVEHTFTIKPESEAQRKHFALPGSNFSCTLAFFGLKAGTMLSCQLDEIGHNFVQSDRSAIDEDFAKNNLSLRYESSFFVLQSYCK